MSVEAKAGVSRRVVLGGAMAAAIAGVWYEVARLRHVDVDGLLNAVCDLVIPATDTPGAVGAKVPAFVQAAIATGLAGAKPDLVNNLAAELDRAADASFLGLAPEQRERVLREHDHTMLSGQPPVDAAWPTIKRLILMGYYTSEVGASHELRYELDHGGFTADVPLHPGDRAYFNNWFGMMI